MPYLQLIVDLVEKSRLPAICPWRDAVELAGLMAYESDVGELWRRMAADVHTGSMHRPGRCGVRELHDGIGDPRHAAPW